MKQNVAHSKKDAEEAFLTLAQRIQRQYNPAPSAKTMTKKNSSNNNNNNANNVVIPAIASHQRPPDEAAAAIGRQLALKFQSVAIVFSQAAEKEESSATTTTTTTVYNSGSTAGGDKSDVASLLPQVPKGIQEKALQCLVNRYVNPAVIVHFLNTLVGSVKTSSRGATTSSTITAAISLQHNMATTTPLVRMEWLPAWIAHAESVVLEDAAAGHGEPSYHALISMIRAFGHYQLFWLRRQQQQQQQRIFSASNNTTTLDSNRNNNNNNNTTTTTPSFQQQQDQTRISTTFRRLQSNPARMIMIREWIQIAFRGTTGSNNYHLDPTERSPNSGSNNIGACAQVQGMITPLMAACVLTLQTPIADSMLFMESLWRECWAEMTTWGDQDFFQALQWLTHSLDLFLWGLPCYSQSNNVDTMTASKELAMRWLLQLLELAAFLSQASSNPRAHIAEWTQWLANIASGTLPRLFAILPSYQISLEAILFQILHVLQRLSHYHYQELDGDKDDDSAGNKVSPFVFLDAVGTLRFAAVVLANPIPIDVQISLQILQEAMCPIPTDTTNNKSGKPMSPVPSAATPTTVAMVLGVASMLLRNEGCQQTSEQLIATLTKLKKFYGQQQGTKSTSNTIRKIKASRASLGTVENVIQFLDNSVVDTENFATFLTKMSGHMANNCSALQQTGCLLFGIGLLLDDSINPEGDAAYRFLEHLLEVYPHLGVSLLPVLVDCINAACLKGDGPKLQRLLEFLCDVLVKDTQCAREIWNLLGVELMTPTTPTVIRASVLRLFPKLCIANKRLYKRVIEALGNNLATSSHNLEIRLAVAATISDLAKEARIRDVSDVIGWIQGFITDIAWIRPVSTLDEENSGGNAALVYYALLALHYLLVAQELDFDLVIAVLNKRLCKVHDIEEVTKLPAVVLETLILLLGDGECDDGDEEDEEKTDEQVDKRLRPIAVSAQVARSVETLIKLALSLKLHPTSANEDMVLRGSLLRCRKNIHTSLAKYSMSALGIDDTGIQAVANNSENTEVPPSGERYVLLRQMILDGIEILESGNYKIDSKESKGGALHSPEEVTESDISPSLGLLISTMLKYEENALGSALWQKRGKKRGINAKGYVNGQVSVGAAQIVALPTPPSIQKIYNENRCPATSLAVLLCFEGKPLSLFSDLAGDISHESSDPLMLAFTVQAWLNAARSTLMELVVSYSSSESLENVLLEIREWRFRLDSPDNIYLSLVSLALMIPEILGPYGDHTPYVNDICDEVWNCYTGHEFENADIGRLCIAFVGVCAIRNRSIEQAMEVVNALERSVTGYGGQASFGAYYGLAIIAQACPLLFETPEGTSNDTVGDGGLIRRIVAFLITQMELCIAGTHAAIGTLVTCIENGEISPDIVDTISELGHSDLKMIRSKKQLAKSVFMGLALCLPALAAVNEELLLGIYCLLDVMPWGYGKGMALSSVLHACRRSGLFQAREIEKIYARHAKIFEEGMDKGIPGLDDIFYAVTATMTKTIPTSIRRFLVGNRTLFDEDGRTVSLLAAVVSLSSVPCLGCGALSFTATAQLSTKATNEDISGVEKLISEAVSSREWTKKYPQVAVLLLGFLASMKNFTELGDGSTHSKSSVPEMSEAIASKLPSAQQGTVLEVVLGALSTRFLEPSMELDESSTNLLVTLLGCLQVLSLPGAFSTFLEHLFRGNDAVKTACTKLLISQIRGRPRAVFDGREYIDQALKMAKMPVTTIKSLLGQGSAPIVFIEALVDLVPKFSTDSTEEVVESFWRLCVNQVGNLPEMSVAYLLALKTLVKQGNSKKSFMISPKTLSFLRHFLVTRVFAGIRDAPWATTSSSSTLEERSIVETYANCLLEVPVASLADAEFFTVKELDGFVGEALRHRCVMLLVRDGYFTTPSRASSEITSAVAWFSRQLTSSEDEIFSSTLLQVARSIAQATSGENADRRRELLLTLLDNLLLTGASASYVGLQMLAVLVCQWMNGSGSDGDQSLICIMSTQMDRWKELSPPTLQQTFRILVHDLPFNLATYARGEKLCGVVSNLLWRIYNRWLEQGADQHTLDCVRKALIHCRSIDSGVDDFISLATSMLM